MSNKKEKDLEDIFNIIEKHFDSEDDNGKKKIIQNDTVLRMSLVGMFDTIELFAKSAKSILSASPLNFPKETVKTFLKGMISIQSMIVKTVKEIEQNQKELGVPSESTIEDELFGKKRDDHSDKLEGSTKKDSVVSSDFKETLERYKKKKLGSGGNNDGNTN